MNTGLNLNNGIFNFTGDNSKKTKLEDKTTGKQLTLQDGFLHINNQEKYTGIATTNKNKEDNWEFAYIDGKITQSRKNDEVKKSYLYPKISGMIHYFDDGSFLDEKEYYGSEFPDVMVVYDGKSTSTIYKYKNTRYKDQPFFDYTKVEDGKLVNARRMAKADGEEITEFKSPDEAKRYFSDEFGINAEFDNLAQAYIAKKAIDDFVDLNVDKKIFNGLSILVDDGSHLDDSECAGTVLIDNGNDVEEIDLSYFENNKEAENEEYDESALVAIYICEHDKTLYVLNENNKISNREGWEYELINPTIFLNRKYNWSCVDESSNSEESGFSSYSTLKGDIQHELAHYLHSKYSPADFFDSLEANDREKEIMEQVSIYATSEPIEFIAEYIPGRIEGKKYSKEVDELYKKYGGPDIFKD